MIAVTTSRTWLPDWARAPLLFAKHHVRGPSGKPLINTGGKPAFEEDGSECACCGEPPLNCNCQTCINPGCSRAGCPASTSGSVSFESFYTDGFGSCKAVLRFQDFTLVSGWCYKGFTVKPGGDVGCTFNEICSRIKICPGYYCGVTYRFVICSTWCTYNSNGQSCPDCVPCSSQIVFTVPSP